MPIPAYMTISLVNQGEISEGASDESSIGTKSNEAHADEIQIQSFRHSVRRPVDPQSGQPVGPRVHEEMIITKIQD
ncbi:MAG: type VI secretion system tube protein Hcp, partial [SAR324 cluster bacterium]|nr:type VI secretion system tube protein Hcp [SAR324 cluster bacterium]